MIPLRVIAVASSESIKESLSQQLSGLDYVICEEVVIDLADAQQLWEKEQPDLLIVDLTGREMDACLFIEVLHFNVENKTTVFGLHKELDPNIILKAVSSGVKEFIHYPKDQDALTTALSKYHQYHQKLIQARIDSGEVVKRAEVIPVFSSKGGSGATTVALNLAYELMHTANKKVAFIDMDQVFSNATAYLNFKPTFSISDLAEDNPKQIDDQLIQKIIVHHEETGLDLMVACKNILDENPMITLDHLDRLFEYLYTRYDYVVLDLPTHAVDEYHQFIVERADTVLLLSSMDLLSLYKTRQYLDLVQHHLDMNKFKLVVNRYDLKAVVGMSSKNLEEQFKYPIFHRLPNNWNIHVEAMSLGKPIGAIQERSDSGRAYQDLVTLLTGVEPESETSEEGGFMRMTNLFGKIKGGSAPNATS